MTFRVEFTVDAAEQIFRASRWWRENRSTAPDLSERELATLLELLADMPPLTAVWGEVNGNAVHKARLPRSRYAIYFTVAEDLVTVHALWHSARGGEPALGG